nr:hypothetical protein [Tanacetum cinerariifolium]
YVVDSDPKKDEKDPKKDPADYPADRGDNDDDKSSNDDDDVEKDEEDKEEKEHLAPADPSDALEQVRRLHAMNVGIKGTTREIVQSKRTKTMKTRSKVLKHVEWCMPLEEEKPNKALTTL